MPRLPSPARLALEHPTRTAILLLVVAAFFRLWFATTLDLIPDESYYWLWSKHLDASYFSKGPAVAWTVALGTHVLGDTVLGIRWIAVLLSVGTGWQIFLLGRRLYDARTGLLAVAVAAIVPIYAVGAILMTIDALSVFFWAWAANLFLDALEQDRLGDWALCGFAVGSGFLAKYVNLLELLGFLGFALSVPRHRAGLLSWRWAVLLGVVVFCAIPVLWWNDHHGWVTTSHLRHRGNLDSGFHLHPGQLLKFLADQILAISPLLIALLIAAGAVLFRPRKSKAEKYCLALFLPTFGFYLLLSFNEAAKGNWTVTAYPAAVLLAVVFWPELGRRSPAARWFWGVSLALCLGVTALLHGDRVPFLRSDKDPILRLRGWTDCAAKMEALREQYRPDTLIANNYANASELAFYLSDRPTVYMPKTEAVENQFSFWPGYEVKAGGSALFVTNDLDYPMPESLVRDYPSRTVVSEFWREYRGRKIDGYRVWLLRN